MNYQLLGDSFSPLAHVALRQGETIKLERGSMAYLSQVDLEGKMNGNKKGIGGVFSAIGRSMTSGESIFMTHATGLADNAFIGIAPSIPGKIHCLKVDDQHNYRLNTGAFLACDENVDYFMKRQDIGKAFFGGTGGLFVMETKGKGDLLITSFGDLLEMNVSMDQPLTIDNEHVVAWDSNLDYSIQIASGTFGFKTGEGLVNEFHGQGKVLVQTRNLHNLADALRPFFPSNSGN